jgi:proteasome accessory factor BC
MAERQTAGDQLSRILYLLPLATREDGASLDELAAALDATPEQVLRDLEEVYTRAYYHPAGSGEDAQILIEPDRVYVWTKGDFQRPMKLSAGEALALGLGLRVLAAEADEARRARILSLAERLEAELATRSAEEQLKRLAIEPQRPDEATVRATVLRAARERRRCRILYLKSGAAEPEERGFEPYVVVAASGWWYVLARCCRSNAVQAFRMDRILDIEPEAATFQIPDDFDPGSHFSEGRVFRAADEVTVAVRYSPRIARWIVEKGPAEACDDGSVVVRYRIADPRWLVRHVLQYGAEAEVLEPAEFRDLVWAAVERVRNSVAAG